MMEAMIEWQDQSRLSKTRLDSWALAPAAAALAYPFLLREFYVVVGPQAVTPPPLAILGAALLLTAALSVPFLGIALARRPSAAVGARRLAYASVAAPTLYVVLGVVQTLVHSPIPDVIVWCIIWLAVAIWSQIGAKRRLLLLLAGDYSVGFADRPGIIASAVEGLIRNLGPEFLKLPRVSLVGVPFGVLPGPWHGVAP